MKTLKKDESYIKKVLLNVFKNTGNFRQFEFNYYGGSERPDFVILEDYKFIYFEIKSEFDSFVRLQNQVNAAQGYFTNVYVVIPKSKLKKFLELNINIGIYLLEDLEKGVKHPYKYHVSNFGWGLSIRKIANILWKFDLKQLLIKKGMTKLGQLDVDSLKRMFLLHYSDNDCLKILNEVLPGRIYNFRS
jgi:hypothetical protein